MCRRLTKTLRNLPLLTVAVLSLAAASCDSDSNYSNSHFPAGNASGPGDSASPAGSDKNKVRVTVAGAVIRPGVYTLDRQSNVAQAILEAGGLTDRAELDKVNLKGALKDDMTIVVPAAPRITLAKSMPSDTSTSASNSSLQTPPVVATPSPSPSPTALMVVVQGAVAKPGAQQLPPGSVVATAIVAAGGLAPNANVGAVNLQQPLRQGMTITVPVNKPMIASERSTPSPVPQMVDAPTAAPVSPLNINDASAAQLQGLPGIGPSLAARIITYRTAVGDFRTPEQLMDVKGISPDKFREIQPLILTD